MINPPLGIPQPHLAALCRPLALFRSALRGDFGPTMPKSCLESRALGPASGSTGLPIDSPGTLFVRTWRKRE